MLRRRIYSSIRRAFATNGVVSASGKQTDLYDVAIVGGGPVGNAMACSIGELIFIVYKD
jgi:NADH dehydrogenase FAD-containing subunit